MSKSSASKLRSDELPYLRDVQAAIVDERHSIGRWSAVLAGVLLIAAVIWAHNASLEIITTGVGKVVPTSREQVIQSLEPGILAEIKVSEGDVVEKDQILLRIDDTRAGASYDEGQARALALAAQVARLKAEVSDTTPQFPDAVKKEPTIVKTEMALFVAKRRSVEESVASIRQSVALIEQELAMTAPLAAKGMMSEVDVLRLRRQASEAKMQIAERWNKYRADANAELAKAEADYAQVASNVTARQDTLRRTVVRAPMRGIVKNVRINTVGGVIQAGQDIMSLVPTDDTLLVEAKVRPADVAFVRPGLPVTVKLSAYDYSLYGGLQGTVQLVSPDTIDETSRSANPQEPYYRVLVRTDKAVLEHKGEKLPIMPGMVATAEILTGHRTVLQYLLRPVMRGQEALRER
jgi:multidrug efflux pump subunit AcrA (membrane-fusion protein)